MSTKSSLRKFFSAATSATWKVTKSYYSWANSLPNRKIGIGMMAVPPIILLGLVVGGPDSASVGEPAAATRTVENIQMPKPVAKVAEVKPEAAYPITLTKTGADFQYTYDGELMVYSDKTVIEATWMPECGEVAPMARQTQKFTYTLPKGRSELTVVREFSDCMNNTGTIEDTDTYRVDADGTIRIDLIEESDGSVIQEDFVVIAGGPAPHAANNTEMEVAVESEVAESVIEPETIYEPAPAPSRPSYSTCKEYNAAGYGNFTPSDPEYTNRRDRDNDGVACEF